MDTKNTTQMIHARIDSNLKQKAEAVFNVLGINTSDAIRMFLTQVTLTQGLPFSVKIPNKETKHAIKDSKLNRNLKHIPIEDFDRVFDV
jgi:DNA-damage-inducible protein J